MDIIEKARGLEPYIIEKRRDFHAHPELKYEEFRTSQIVKDELESFGYETITVADTGVIGILKGKTGKMVALRADMDALPIDEENEIPYKSTIPGKMHACGHDAHTAMLLGAARILSENRDELNGTIKVIFQPAEEGGLGAKKIVEEGHLSDVHAIFGIHVWADMSPGTIGITGGPLMAASDGFEVTIKGRGGHAAAPHRAIDPIAVTADIINGYQKLISRETDPLDPVIISVTKIAAGTAFNVIPESAEFGGTIRTFSSKKRDKTIKRMKEITEGYAAAMRCNGDFELSVEHIPPTINDNDLADFAKDVLKTMGEIVKPKPIFGSEDFAFYSQKVPALFLLLGTGGVYPHHHPRFDVDETVLYKGSAAYALLAYNYLHSPE